MGQIVVIPCGVCYAGDVNIRVCYRFEVGLKVFVFRGSPLSV